MEDNDKILKILLFAEIFFSNYKRVLLNNISFHVNNEKKCYLILSLIRFSDEK